MNYCKYGPDSDICVYPSIWGYFVCLNCDFVEGGFRTRSRKDLLNHLLLHKLKGYKFPDLAIKKLQEEIKVKGDAWDLEEGVEMGNIDFSDYIYYPAKREDSIEEKRLCFINKGVCSKHCVLKKGNCLVREFLETAIIFLSRMNNLMKMGRQ